MNIVLIGFMGTGKSAVGRALALRLGVAFLDTTPRWSARPASDPPHPSPRMEWSLAFRGILNILLRTSHSLSLKDRVEGDPHPATGRGMPLRYENVAVMLHSAPSSG